MRSWTLGLFALLAAGSASACGDDDDATESAMHPGAAADSGAHEGGVNDAGGRDAGRNAPQVLVGAVDDTDIALGAVIAHGRARMFFCGGPSSYAQATHWLQLELEPDLDGGAGFEQESDGFAVQGSLQGASLRGELMRPGEPTASFSAELAREGTLAGLYDGDDDCGHVGLIVTQRSVRDAARGQGACVGAGHAPQQVNPILPIARGDDGSIPVELVTDDGTQSARVQAAAAPSAQ